MQDGSSVIDVACSRAASSKSSSSSMNPTGSSILLAGVEISIVRHLDRTSRRAATGPTARAAAPPGRDRGLSDTWPRQGDALGHLPRPGRRDRGPPRPRDRRLLIEEAAGLGKHRKRRRREAAVRAHAVEPRPCARHRARGTHAAQARPKRQPEAAELHERLELQILQARSSLRSDSAAVRRVSSRRRRAAGRGGPARAAARSRRACRRPSTAEGRPSARWLSAPSATTRSRVAFARRARRASAWPCALSRCGTVRRRLRRRIERVGQPGSARADGAGAPSAGRGTRSSWRAPIASPCARDWSLRGDRRDAKVQIAAELDRAGDEPERQRTLLAELEGELEGARERRALG